MTTSMVLQQVAENEMMNILSVVVLIGIMALVVLGDYRPRWHNVKKARIFREKF